MFKIVTVWLVLGTVVFLGFQAWQGHERRTQFSALEGVIEIRRSPDGHYHWPGSVNGMAVDFLVDTGATSTALPLALASRAGLVSQGRVTSSTAGGIVQGTVSSADLELEGGVRVTRLRVTVLPGLAAPLLGMDVLSKLRWSQGSGVLRVESRQ
ncbi:MAG: retroviral-like aspartic protease family protein [Burkholderiaceae bacterium]|nr:retroviral-like aspartic protease family protein [Burkholderiaceae bacterium]